ncbi:TFIIB-type zinc ribbon-containing protein [Butyrivibrio sp. AE2032]|uniref:TFIIB-type zinc ribbon-containing protein n=1 Tax=Butyrivibrio sp. AE2032 TaxID=1458463 RepID=UPI0005527678|nr:TFIIB-type zinc ribbon-containing protein [Butyrivibrio sp. AE2032]
MAIWDKASGTGSGTESLSANSVKCPNCGSNLFFDLEHGACICRFCGGVFDSGTLDKVGSFGLSNFEKEYDGTVEMSKEDESRIEVVCDSCGAQIITDKNTASTTCAFCGSPALVTRRLTREFKPDYIIPFKFDKEKAISLFEEYCAGIEHLPKDFGSKKVLSKMTGLYVPTWIVSSEVEVNIAGRGYKGRMADTVYEENFNATVDSVSQSVYGKIKFRLKDVPFDGEKNIANRLMAAAEPFDFKELVTFRSEYLQGFFAEKYDEQPLDMTGTIYRRLDRYALSVCEKITFGYDSFVPSSEQSTTRYRNQEVKYALLPIWFLSIDFNGKRYQYIINGQTGKVSGEFPYAKGWEAIERGSRRAKMNSVSWKRGIRLALYLMPWFIFVLVGGIMILSIDVSMYINNHPLECLIYIVLIVLFTIFLSAILPKIMLDREKRDIAELSKTDNHDLAPELGVEAYYDPSFPISAVQTNGSFVELESGWKYSEQKRYFARDVRHDAAEEVVEDENATDFEKKGYDRRMMR